MKDLATVFFILSLFLGNILFGLLISVVAFSTIFDREPKADSNVEP